MSFGHIGIIGNGFCLDKWGVGPFAICAGGKLYRFEDSDMFGPTIIKKDGDPKIWQPGQYHPFWDAHKAWREQGRRTEGGVYCVYDAIPPTVRGVSVADSDSIKSADK